MITYEWDYETIDSNGDIIEHNHADKLSDFALSDITPSLVLIRNVGSDSDGLQDRTWAYVANGILPEYFQDAAGCNCAKVPGKFKAELKRHVCVNNLNKK